MITDALLIIVQTLTTWVNAALPSWSFTSTADYQGWVKSCQYLNLLLPITEIVQCFTLYVSFATGVFAWKWIIKIADWIADIIP